MSLALVTSSILAGLGELGIRDPFTVVLLTTALGATAVRRSVDPSPARQCSPREAVFVGSSVLAWVAVGFIAWQAPQGLARYSFDVPVWLRLAGAALLLVEIAQPLLARVWPAQSASSGVNGPMELSARELALVVGVSVASANLVLVGLGAACVAGLLLLKLWPSGLSAPVVHGVLAGARLSAAE